MKKLITELNKLGYKKLALAVAKSFNFKVIAGLKKGDLVTITKKYLKDCMPAERSLLKDVIKKFKDGVLKIDRIEKDGAGKDCAQFVARGIGAVTVPLSGLKVFAAYKTTADKKPSFGKAGKNNYAVKIESLDRNDFYNQSFGRQLDDLRKIKEWKKEAKIGDADAKGKATLSAVKKWIKENKPKEFYASWQADSSNYKDDSVEIYYKK